MKGINASCDGRGEKAWKWSQEQKRTCVIDVRAIRECCSYDYKVEAARGELRSRSITKAGGLENLLLNRA